VPTYKEQQEQLKEKDLNTFGFLGYPVLADRGRGPVRRRCRAGGQDQVSHLEVAARSSASSTITFAKPHKPILVEPHPYLTDVPRSSGSTGAR